PRPSIYIPEFIAANQEERADNVLRGSKAEQVPGWGGGRGGGGGGHGGGGGGPPHPPPPHTHTPCRRVPAARPGGVPVHALRRGQHPGGLRLHQRLPPKHLRAGRGGAGRPAPRLHLRRRLQVRADQAQVGAGGFPGGRRAQDQVHRELQPPGEQRREEPLGPAAVPLQGDLQEQRGGRHGAGQPRALRPARQTRPLRGDQIRALRGGQQAGAGRVHVGDHDGRHQHHRHPQHLRGARGRLGRVDEGRGGTSLNFFLFFFWGVGPQDSLLASPIILDLAILTELCQRITFCTEGDPEFQGFHSVLSIVAFLCKAPLVPEGTPVVNALFRQRSCIENILRYPHPRVPLSLGGGGPGVTPLFGTGPPGGGRAGGSVPIPVPQGCGCQTRPRVLVLRARHRGVLGAQNLGCPKFGVLKVWGAQGLGCLVLVGP
uniref:Inositol-3-phosphate synthase n=1 Tax=Anas platyrhynchos platyrhynchos TaxID=8840 RepID=A0A493T2J0_ANAPP